MSVEEFLYLDETKIMGYGESDSSGAWIKLQIMPEDLDKFRGLKGQILETALKKVGHDGQLINEKKNIHLRLIAIELCDDSDFQIFMNTRFGGRIDNSLKENAVEGLKQCCGITSRSELDTNPEAARRLAALRTDFNVWRRSNNLDCKVMVT